ncbi:tRNA-splicing endonuclease subunit [Ptychographa xylographoides]|nr:tRNA-splicing endonuclease subunit [Ptychographa xylographoides]
MVVSPEDSAPALPFPIFRISSAVCRYALYDINVITWLRKTHHILGVLIGTLPQIPQQNVFLGLPLELMPEEARLLSEKGLAYVVDDLEWQQKGMASISMEQRRAFRRGLAREGKEASKAAERKKMESTERAVRRLRLGSTPSREATASPRGQPEQTADTEDPEALLFLSTPQSHGPPSTSGSHSLSEAAQAWAITPTTSYPPLQSPPNDLSRPLPDTKISSYALFKYLHSRDYYMSPGLRFGCEFLVYPGDPLRFHSHFLAVGFEWDEEFDLMNLVGGGRLGTGVKKGWLIGGASDADAEQQTRKRNEPYPKSATSTLTDLDDQKIEEVNGPSYNKTAAVVRTFCIEWGGM